jgi:hypothetical protein
MRIPSTRVILRLNASGSVRKPVAGPSLGRRFLLGVLITPPFVLAACSSSTTPSSTTTTSAKSSFEVSTSEGQVSISLDGKLPPNWPTDAPVPRSATPAGSGSLVGQSKGLIVGVYTSPDSPEKVCQYYTTQSSITTTSQAAVGHGSHYVGRVKISSPVDVVITGGTGR